MRPWSRRAATLWRSASLQPLVHGRVHADFRNELEYFRTAFDLILSLYQLPPIIPLLLTYASRCASAS
jgi:hypothetical protein